MDKNKINIKHGNGQLTIHYERLREYHQDTNYAMLAITFKGIQGIFELFKDTPCRKDLKVVSAHPGTGVKDALEFVTRAVTNDKYELNCSLPYANYNPHKQMGYYFEISNGNKTVTATLKEGVLCNDFFDFFGKSQNKIITEEEKKKFAKLIEKIEIDSLNKNANELFKIEEK